MSGLTYPTNAPSYGASTIAIVANPTAAYTAKPTDLAVLVDLSAYSGAGPTITWTSTPREDFPVLIRSVAGSGASHNWTIAAPTGLTIENPTSPGTFAASVSVTAAFEGGVWNFDRANRRLFLESILVAAAAPATPIAFDETQNNAPVTLGTAPVVVATRTFTTTSGQTIYVFGCCTIKNVSEGQVNGGDITVQLNVDGSLISGTATGAQTVNPNQTYGYCGFVWHGTLAAGSHIFALVATSTDNTGAHQVQTNQGTLNFEIFG